MASVELEPQVFDPNAVTDIPERDFFELIKARLPLIYKDSVKLMAVIEEIAKIKQKIYDNCRSLVNAYNLFNSGGGVDAKPTGVFLKTLASDFGVFYGENDTDEQVAQKILTQLNLVVTRGKAIDFFNYFVNHGLENDFNNTSVQEIGNATLLFNVPIINDPLQYPNLFLKFINDMERMKGAGIKISAVSQENVPWFQFSNIAGEVDEGNAGFASLNIFGQAELGGHLIDASQF